MYMTLELSEMKASLNREMQEAGLINTEETASRLACVFSGVYLLKIATHQEVLLPPLPNIDPQHLLWVSAWLQELPARIEQAIDETYDSDDGDE
jgi:hypothetical protein